ncbi:glycoside hydrolase family 16 protein [Mucilaginibacter terrenus]|uniref:Glycoside hydrolase family 16 protein n=1 Tax=Mucilaginibacter terrenus TaxID=2482727 RepID=A0A3E2NRA2_9SPHI|nr:glycoside hydrolase family 16 protein [Mucilaginibacter terrenus]RFZ83525.1 glycoside hydrolase family 16 protein [Mucilaginibacter terrenus]
MNISRALLACAVLSVAFFSCGKKNDATPRTPTIVPPVTIEDKGWAFETTPYFADEFNVDGAPNTASWGYDNGGGGWGNNELEYYTPANVAIAAGKLTITAKKEAMGGLNYTSTRLVSKGAGTMKYGRVEVKAKLPAGTGTWPAIWMLPDTYAYGNWPNSGEIDIMEMVGFDPGNVHFTVHNQTYNGANGKGDSKVIATASTDYHLYRVDWTPYAIRGYYDDALVFTYVNNNGGSATWPYDQNFHLLLNIAVGGSWGGQKGVDDTSFPTTMDVDYVHFYKMIDK